jgi:hypothetical protein
MNYTGNISNTRFILISLGYIFSAAAFCGHTYSGIWGLARATLVAFLTHHDTVGEARQK